jgi:hypothetical protein
MRASKKGVQMNLASDFYRVLPLLAGFALLSACSDAQETPETGSVEAAIIGGAHADSPELDVVGTLELVDSNGSVRPFCTGTLLNAETVLTARHCVDLLDELVFYGYDSAFAVGSDANAPKQLLKIAAVDTPSGSFGGFIGFGRDVAVIHLATPAAGNYKFPAVGASKDLVIGERLVSIGYGVYSAGEAFDGKRRIGRETVAATSGLTLEAMLGDFESFVEWNFTGSVTDANILDELGEDNFVLDELYDLYTAFELIPGYEMVAGLGKEDTQSCYGDSGGPMLRFNADGTRTTFAVVSGGLDSVRSACDFGGVYATFGEEVVDFLASATKWQDPCGSTSEQGSCEGDLLLSCKTNLIAGTRQIQALNCAADSLPCVANQYGAACGAAPLPPSEPEATGDAGTAVAQSNSETPDVKDLLASRFHPQIATQKHWRK